jgi:hypothetical protein
VGDKNQEQDRCYLSKRKKFWKYILITNDIYNVVRLDIVTEEQIIQSLVEAQQLNLRCGVAKKGIYAMDPLIRGVFFLSLLDLACPL